MIYKFLPLLLLFFASFAPKSTNNTDPKLLANTKVANLAVRIEMIYNSLDANSFALPQVECFKRAMTGFYALKQKGLIEKDILTVIDFSLSSTKKRMWIIDLVSNKILFNTVVSHGRNSGLEYATSFSNQSNL